MARRPPPIPATGGAATVRYAPSGPGWRQIPPYVLVTRIAAALATFPFARRPVIPATYGSGLVFVLAFFGCYSGVMQTLAPRYDLAKAAAPVTRVQATGAPVGYLGGYHAQFSFLG